MSGSKKIESQHLYTIYQKPGESFYRGCVQLVDGIDIETCFFTMGQLPKGVNLTDLYRIYDARAPNLIHIVDIFTPAESNEKFIAYEKFDSTVVSWQTVGKLSKMHEEWWFKQIRRILDSLYVMESLGIHHRMLSDPTSYVIRDDDIYLINDGKFVSTLDDNMAKSDMTSLFEFLYSRMQFLRDMECNVSKLCFECGTVNQVRKLPFLLTLQEQYKYTRQIFKFVKIHMSSDERKKFFTELFNYKKYLGNWRRKCRKFDVLYEVLNFSTHDYDADSPTSLFTFIEKVLNHIEERAEALKPDLKKVPFSREQVQGYINGAFPLFLPIVHYVLIISIDPTTTQDVTLYYPVA